MTKRLRGARLAALAELGVTAPVNGFTDKWVDRGAKVLPCTYVISDRKTTGLELKVSAAGKKTWLMHAVYPGFDMPARRKLGPYPTMSLEKARHTAREWHKLIRNGIDPQTVEKEKKRAAEAERHAKALKDAQTFAAAAERFIDEHVVGQRRGEAVAREVRNYLVAEWGDHPIGSITPADVKVLIGRIKSGTHPQARKHKNGAKRGAPYQAENVLGAASVLFKWATHNDLITFAPTASLSKKWILSGAKLGPRQRLLSDDELRAFWRATLRLGYPFGPLYRLLLLTGTRLNEIAKAQWSELHSDIRKVLRDASKSNKPVDWRTVPAESKVLVVPRERFKSDTEHHVLLTDYALRIIEQLPCWSRCDFLFSITGRGPINSMSAGKERLDQLMLRYLRALARLRGEEPATVKLQPFVIHDTRRVIRSRIGAIRLPLPTEGEKQLPEAEREKREKARHNIPDHICEMVLGHGRKGLQRTYDMNKYALEIREALDAWAMRLHEIVNPQPSAPARSNLVRLRGQP